LIKNANRENCEDIERELKEYSSKLLMIGEANEYLLALLASMLIISLMKFNPTLY
jgi:soluble P-type ATPase